MPVHGGADAVDGVGTCGGGAHGEAYVDEGCGLVPFVGAVASPGQPERDGFDKKAAAAAVQIEDLQG